MNSDFIRRVGACLAKLNVTFPHVACSVPATLVWAEAFDGIDIEDVEAGCREYIKYETKQPTPAHIRKRAKDIKAARIKESKAVRAGNITYYNPPAPVSDGLTPEKCKAYLEKRAALKAIPQTPAKPSAERIAAFEKNRLEAIEIMKRKLGESQ